MGSVFTKESKKLLILGQHSSGKTTLLYQLKLNKDIKPDPTIGFNNEEIVFDNIKYNTWDVSIDWHFKIDLFTHYFEGVDVLIFVTDSSNKNEISKAKAILDKIYKIKHMKNIPVLVLANKSDKAELTIEQITEILQLKTVENIGQSNILSSCAINGEGTTQGLTWISSLFKQ